MANKKNNIQIKIDIANIQETLNSLEKLSIKGGQLGSNLEGSIQNVEKLLDATQSGSKVTSNQLSKYSRKVKETQSILNLSFKKHLQEKSNTENAINSLNSDAKLLVENLQKAEKKLKNIQNSGSNNNLMKSAQEKLKKSNLSQESINKYGNSFSTLGELENWSKKSLQTSGGKDRSPEEQQKILVAKELLRLYKEEQQTIAKKESTQRIEVGKTRTELEKTIKVLRQEESHLEELNKITEEDFKKASEGLSKTSYELGAAQANMSSQGATVGNLSSSQEWRKAAKTFAHSSLVFSAFKKIIQESVQAIMNIDEAITNMTVVTGESREETSKYVQEFSKIGQASSSTITEIASLTTEYARQGRTMEESLVLAEETAKAAKIAGISVSDSLTYMTSAINGFNLAASDAQHVSDVFARVAAETATDYNQLAVALSKVSAQASQAGLSMEYTTALLAKGIETTQEAPESIGTALKTIIARFRELSDYGSTLEDGVSVNQVEDALSAVGIAARDSSGEFRDLDDILNELGPRWDSLTGMQRQAIAQAAAGTRQQSRFLAIMQDWDRTLEVVNISQEAAGASAAQYEKYAKGLTASITNLKNSWESFVISLSDSEFIIDIIDFGTDFMNGFTKLINKSEGLVPKLIMAGAALSGFIMQKAKIEQGIFDRYSEELEKRKSFVEYEKESLASRMEARRKEVINQIEEARNKEKEYRLGEIRLQIQAKQEELAEKERHLEVLRNLRIETKEKLENLKKIATAEGKDTSAIDLQLQGLGRQSGEELRTKKDIRIISSSIDSLNRDLVEEEAKIDAIYDKQIASVQNFTSKATDAFNKTVSGFQKVGSGIGNLFKDPSGSLQSVLTKIKNIDWGNIKDSLGEFVKSPEFGKMASGALVALATTMVTVATDAVKGWVNLREESLETMSALSTDTYDKTTEISNIQKMKKEYEELSQKINKTAEEESRLAEIEEEMKKSYGVDVNNLDDFNNIIDDYNAKIGANTEASIAEAFKVSIKEGSKIFEETEFNSTLKLRLKSLNDADTSTAQGQYQSETYDKLSSNVDLEGMAKNISNKRSSEAKLGNAYFGYLAGMGAAGTTGIAAAALLSAGVSLGPVGWAALAITGVGATVAATVETVKANSSRAAKEMAEEIAVSTTKISNELNDFSEKFSSAYDKDLSSQFLMYESLAGQYSSATNAAIRETYKGFALLSKLEKEGKISNADEFLKTVQQVSEVNGEVSLGFSNAEVTKILDEAGELGKDAAEKFYQKWLEYSKKGDVTSEIVASNLIKELNTVGGDLNNSIVKGSESKRAEAKARKDAANNLLTTFENMSFDAFIKRNKAYKGMSYSEVQAKLESQVETTTEQFNKADDALSDLNSTLLQTISSFGSLQELGQGLTQIDSSMKNAREFADRVAEGTATIEDWVNASTQYADLLSSEEWSTLTNQQKADLISQQTTAFDAAERREKEIDNYLARLDAEKIISGRDIERRYQESLEAINNSTKLTEKEKEEEREDLIKERDASIKALEDNTNATKAAAQELKNMTVELSEQELKNISNTRLLQKAEEEIEKGNLSGYSLKESIKTQQQKEQKDAIDSYLKSQITDDTTRESWKKVLGDLYSGDLTSYKELLKTLTSGEKEAFEIIWKTYSEMKDAHTQLSKDIEENTKANIEAQISMQKEVIEVYKEQLKTEQEELKNSLDKRKEMYEKYFDSLEGEEDRASFEEEQARLQRAIASLSASSDAGSLAKLKEYQEELAELEDEQRSSERERRRDATMANLDNESEALDQYYDERLKNEQKLWEEISAFSKEQIVDIFKTYNEEFIKATSLEQKELLDAFSNKAGQLGSIQTGTTNAYSKGGLVNYTGLAMVHGSSSKPEAFLNADQTALFADLAAGLQAIYSQGYYSPGGEEENSSITVENINITVQGNSNNPTETGNSLADALLEGLKRTGISVNVKR